MNVGPPAGCATVSVVTTELTTPTAGSTPGQRTVLVVEDEPTVRETVAEALAADGLRVITAADGRQALERFRAEQPDLVLLDLMLPGDVGHGGLPHPAPRVVGAHHHAHRTRLGGRQGGRPGGRRGRLRDQAIQPARAPGAGPGAPPPAGGRHGSATLDLPRSSWAPSRSTSPGIDCCAVASAIPVKPQAFELLAFLLRNPGQVFTRDQLLERVWGYDYAGETRTVDVHVHWLRGHIEEDSAHPRFLQTVRGVGYVLRLDEG